MRLENRSAVAVARPENVGQEAKSRVAHTQGNIFRHDIPGRRSFVELRRLLIDMLGVYGRSTNMMRGTCCKKENVKRKNAIPGQELFRHEIRCLVLVATPKKRGPESDFEAYAWARERSPSRNSALFCLSHSAPPVEMDFENTLRFCTRTPFHTGGK